MKEKYVMTVMKEVETFLIIMNKNIIPRAYSYRQTIPKDEEDPVMQKRYDDFRQKLAKLLK